MIRGICSNFFWLRPWKWRRHTNQWLPPIHHLASAVSLAWLLSRGQMEAGTTPQRGNATSEAIITLTQMSACGSLPWSRLLSGCPVSLPAPTTIVWRRTYSYVWKPWRHRQVKMTSRIVTQWPCLHFPTCNPGEIKCLFYCEEKWLCCWGEAETGRKCQMFMGKRTVRDSYRKHKDIPVQKMKN